MLVEAVFWHGFAEIAATGGEKLNPIERQSNGGEQGFAKVCHAVPKRES
jgi:hypothetical protein